MNAHSELVDSGRNDESLMRILTYSSLYPNALQPRHGVFVEQRLKKILDTGELSAQVLAPVPWFPFTHSRFGKYALYPRVPAREIRSGVELFHPRYVVLPKIGMSLAPWLMAAATLPAVRRLARGDPPLDLIDAHYFYPDGVAAVLIGRRLGLPVTITARGSDLNLLPRYFVPRRMIRWAARHCAGIATVSASLRDRLTELGLPASAVEVLPNGVDLQRFRPVDRGAARERLGWAGPTLLSVGNLVPNKGHHLAIEALRQLPEVRLAIAGAGPLRSHLAQVAESCSVAQRVSFLGELPQERLRECYGAADATVLASAMEGMPNVVLESIACGTPVVATDVGGIGEVIAAPCAGTLVRERTAGALAQAIRGLLDRPPAREETRRYAGGHSWDATVRGQLKLFSRVATKRNS